MSERKRTELSLSPSSLIRPTLLLNRDGGTPAPRPVIEIPSMRDVYAAQRRVTSINLFRSSGQASPSQPPQQPHPVPEPRPVDPFFAEKGGRGQPPGTSDGAPTPQGGGGAFSAAFAGARALPQFQPLPAHMAQASARPPPVAPALLLAQTIPPHHANAAPPQLPAGVTAPAWNGRVLLVNRRQQGNPLLQHIRNVRWQFADILPDYQMGLSTCALFLSLKFHMLHPDYVAFRFGSRPASCRRRRRLIGSEGQTGCWRPPLAGFASCRRPSGCGCCCSTSTRRTTAARTDLGS